MEPSWNVSRRANLTGFQNSAATHNAFNDKQHKRDWKGLNLILEMCEVG